MDERKFLSKIRKLQESGEKIGLTEFPAKLKDGNKFLMSENKILIKEEEVQTVEPDEQRDEENKFSYALEGSAWIVNKNFQIPYLQVQLNNDVITYTGKTTNTLTGITRSNPSATHTAGDYMRTISV